MLRDDVVYYDDGKAFDAEAGIREGIASSTSSVGFLYLIIAGRSAADLELATGWFITL